MDDFVDYYELMQISPRAEIATIRRVYRMLAARYHPDNQETGDLETFILLEEAYAVLNDPEQRQAYDAQLAVHDSLPNPVFELRDFVVGVDAEANRRLGILCLLYNKRRSSPDQPGMSLLDLETRTALPREHLDFTVWYLREKSYVRREETSNDMIITAAGADFVESQSRDSRIVNKLLKAPARTGSRASDATGAPAGDILNAQSSSGLARRPV